MANAVSALVSSETELRQALTDRKTEITLNGNIGINNQISVGYTTTFNGGTITSLTAGTYGSDDAVVYVSGAGTVFTASGTVFDGSNQGSKPWNCFSNSCDTRRQGVKVYGGAQAVLNHVTIKNAKKSGLHVNGASTAIVTNVTTSGNGSLFGGLVVSGGGTITIDGKSTHTSESANARIDGSGVINDIKQQYYSVGNIRFLKSAPGAPVITAPVTPTAVTTTSVNAVWDAPSTFGGTRNAAASYNVSINGGSPVNVTATNYTIDGLTDGTYTISVQSVAASGLTGGIATQTFTVAVPVPEAPTNLKVKVTPTGSDVAHLGYTNRNQLTASWDAPAGGADSYIYTYWNDVATSPYTAASPWTNSTTATSYPGTVNQGEGVHHWSVRAVKDGVPSELATTYTYMYETTPPTATIATPVSSVNTTVPFTISGMYDDTHAPTQSGVGRLHLYVSANGNTLAQPFIVPASQLNQVSGLYSYTLTSADVARLSSELNLQSGQQFTVTAWVYDRANNWTNTTKKTFSADNTKPTIHVKGQGNAFTPTSLGNGNIFREVSFKLFDSGKIDRAEINGVNKNLTDDFWSDVDNVKPGVLGAVEGKNVLVVYDVAGNSTTLEFYLDTVAPVVDRITLGDGTTLVEGAVVSGEQTFIAHITENGLPFNKPSYTLVEIWSEDGTQWKWGPDKTPVLSGTTKHGKTPALAIDTGELPDGKYTLKIRGEDFAKNSFSAEVQFTINNTTPVEPEPEVPETPSGPTITINNPPLLINGVYTFTGTTDAAANGVEVRFVSSDVTFTLPASVSETPDGVAWSVAVASWLFAYDIPYHIHAVATDTEGRTTESQILILTVPTPSLEAVLPLGPPENGSSDADEEDPEQDNFIAFLPSTFGGLNDGGTRPTSPLIATPVATNDNGADVLGAEDVRTSWSAVNAALAGFIAILAVVALAGIRRGQADNNTGARIFTLVPAAAAVIAFFVIEDIGGSMGWFNVWTWLFAGILVVQAILATLTTRTAND